MSRRMTETTKWRDPWFRKLTPAAKLLWCYLCDNCNQAGIIELDVDGASFDIGIPITREHIDELKSRISEKEGKLLLRKFIDFQCGNLSEKCPAHKPVIAAIEKYGLVRNGDGYDYPKGSLPKGIDKPKDTLKKPEIEIPVIPASLSSSKRFMELWDVWLEHLAEKKKKPTRLATKMQLEKLEEMGVDRAISTLKHSITNGWQGLFEPDGSKPRPLPEQNQIQENIDVPSLVIRDGKLVRENSTT